MLNRTRLLLYVNVALFIYSVSEMIKVLLVHNNFFSQFFNNLSTNIKTLTTKIYELAKFNLFIDFCFINLSIIEILAFYFYTFRNYFGTFDYRLCHTFHSTWSKVWKPLCHCCNGNYSHEYLANIQRFQSFINEISTLTKRVLIFMSFCLTRYKQRVIINLLALRDEEC